MSDFKGKVIKIFLNYNNGYVCETGLYIDTREDFIVIKNVANEKIQYVPKYSIKYIEIVKEVGGNDYE